MKEQVKIVLIGAGSFFSRGTLADILSSDILKKLTCHIVLVDIDKSALDEIQKLADQINTHYGNWAQIEATTDRQQALPDADFVIMAVERKRYELWEQDYRVPLAFGFRHVLGENGGPGALFHALRNYEIVLPICRDIEKLSPQAWLLNFTNPESRILMAISHLTKIKAVGLCHGVLEAREYIAELLERDLDDLDIITGGLNHFFWVLKLKDKKTGEDLYPVLRQKAAESAPPLVRKMVEVFGCFTYPSDDHIGEYLSFGSEFTGNLWQYGWEAKNVAAELPASLQSGWRGEFLNGNKSNEELLKPSGEIAVGIICDIIADRKTWRPTVNVLNSDGFVENLPTEAVVEVPAVVDAGGIHPQHVGPLPEALAAFSRTQVSIQKILLQAYQQRSRNLLLQALLIDPVIDNATNAEKMLDYMLQLQKDYLGEYSD
ncbi:MAG: hypothetical protein JXD22_16180 [Sedimentisphaerales bacterium]|nr:hypothetical protein [Sedimentisphaerales bacterium]